MIQITDTDKELLLMAAETIRLYCKGEICCDCIFNDSEMMCVLRLSVPADWEVNRNVQDDQH